MPVASQQRLLDVLMTRLRRVRGNRYSDTWSYRHLLRDSQFQARLLNLTLTYAGSTLVTAEGTSDGIYHTVVDLRPRAEAPPTRRFRARVVRALLDTDLTVYDRSTRALLSREELTTYLNLQPSRGTFTRLDTVPADGWAAF